MQCSYPEPIIVLRFIGPCLKPTRVCLNLMVGQEVVPRDLLPRLIVMIVFLIIFISDILVIFLTDQKINILTVVCYGCSPLILTTFPHWETDHSNAPNRVPIGAPNFGNSLPSNRSDSTQNTRMILTRTDCRVI